jgi:hypothetical protein
VNGREPESRAGEVSESRLEKAIDRRHVRFPGVLAERHRQFLDISTYSNLARLSLESIVKPRLCTSKADSDNAPKIQKPLLGRITSTSIKREYERI